MGRKSTKGAKERKQKRKEENAKLSESQAKIDAANKLEDPMANLQPFKRFERNRQKLTIECLHPQDMDRDTQDFVFQLCKGNMQAIYEAAEWGWNDRDVRAEMMEEKGWYLIVRDQQQLPVAFVHFQFEIEIEEHVLYCREVQLTRAVQRKGLGKFLVQILELIAFKTEMVRVMLTVFKQNEAANKFFKDALKYEVDEVSPSDCCAFEEEIHYEILSKIIKPKASNTQIATKPTECQSGPVRKCCKLKA